MFLIEHNKSFLLIYIKLALAVFVVSPKIMWNTSSLERRIVLLLTYNNCYTMLRIYGPSEKMAY